MNKGTGGIFKVGALLARFGVGFFSIQGAPTNGTAGTYANLADKGSVLFDQTNGIVYLNTNTKASPTWSQVYPVIEGGLAAASAFGLGVMRVAHAKYDFAVDGGAVSTITLTANATIPNNAIVIGGTINSTTAAVGATATIAVGTAAGSSTSSLLAATAVTSFTTGAKLNSAATFAAPVKLTAAGAVTITIATAALTAGVIEIFAAYYVAQNA